MFEFQSPLNGKIMVFADGIDMRQEKRGEIKNDTMVFGLSN